MSDWPWPAPVDDGAAAHLAAGLRLPAVALPSSAGVDITLADVPGLVVAFVYPFTGVPGEADPPGWDDIPGAHGSTAQAQGFRDCMPQFAMRGVKVFGISAQPSASQQAFARRCAITYPLLSDRDLRFADALRLPRFETGGVTYLKRLTLLLCDGTLKRFVYPVHPPDTHAQVVLSLLD